MKKGATLAKGVTASSVGLLGAGLLVALIAVLDADVSGSGMLDVPVFLLSWAWLLAPPATCVAGIILARRARSRWLLVVNSVVLAIWALSTAYLMTLHG
jgi:hypothetical protein